MIPFYVLEIGYLTQYKYAWFDLVGEVTYSVAASMCPECNASLGKAAGWNPPHVVDIKQPRNVGDFVAGAGGCDIVVSHRFLTVFQDSGLTGIEAEYPITVRRMGTTRQGKYPIPDLVGLDVVTARTCVNFDSMGVVWREHQSDNFCPACGHRKNWKSIERIVVDYETFEGHDMFYASNLPGIILLSQRASKMIVEGGFTNAEVIPCDRYKYAFLV